MKSTFAITALAMLSGLAVADWEDVWQNPDLDPKYGSGFYMEFPPIADAGPDETVFVGQMVFIGEWTSYEIPKTVPQLRIVETQLLLCEEYGLGPTICELADLHAFFDPEVDEIVTYRDCFSEKIECEACLFHEIVHYVQDNGCNPPSASEGKQLM